MSVKKLTVIKGKAMKPTPRLRILSIKPSTNKLLSNNYQFLRANRLQQLWVSVSETDYSEEWMDVDIVEIDESEDITLTNSETEG